MIYKNNFDHSRWLYDLEVLKRAFKEVSYGADKDGLWIQGQLSIETEIGRDIGPFTLKIVFNDDYYLGKMPPSTYLVSHRDKWKPLGDAHIEKDWKLCLFLYFESSINFLEYDSFQKYLKSLSSFMLDLWLYQQEVIKVGSDKAKWPGLQRSHNLKGYIEGLIANLKEFDADCPCGSLRNFSTCCKKMVDDYVRKEILHA